MSRDLIWFAHGRAQPGRQVLPLYLSVQVGVIQGSHLDALRPKLLPLLPARLSSAWGQSHSRSVISDAFHSRS